MRNTAQTNGRVRVRHAFGLLLCALLFFFAVRTKTALYRPHQDQVKALTSNKVWQNNKIASPATAPAIQATALLTLAFLLLEVVFSDTRETRVEQPATASFSWFYPTLSVRPPPAS